MRDYKCSFENSQDSDRYVLLPKCRTVEAEALGGNIKLGDSKGVARAGEPAYESLEELLELREIDFTEGRIRETLEALGEAKKEGKVTVLEITGPTTILTSLVDPKVIYKAYRKTPDLAVEVMNKIGDRLLSYIDEAKKFGVDIILYSDSAGALDIVGPKIMEMLTAEFLADFVKKAAEKMDDSCVLMVCPKHTLALLDTGKATCREHQLEPGIDYLDALLQMKSSINIAGQVCFKHEGVKLSNGIFWEIVV